MKKILTLAICYLIHLTNFAQAPGTVTTVEGVYGGRINAIVGDKIGTSALADSFRVFVATESANSIFYATATMPTLGTSSMGNFTALPSANATTGFGSSISKMAYHKKSGNLFFIANANVYAATIAATAATQLTTSGGYIDVAVDGDSYFALSASGSNNTLYYYSINATTGALTLVNSKTISGDAYTNIVVGKNDKLYLFRSSTDPQSVKFSGNISTGVTTSTYTTDTMSSLSSSYSWNAMGVYSDSTVFVGGTNGGTNPYKYLASSSTFGTTYTTIATGIAGTSGSNIEFRTGLVSNYYVYFGSAYSNAKGAASTWSNFGNTSFDTHPNDGYVRFFQENIATGGILLLTTDAGLGWTKNSGASISDINNGILATQVQDFDMNSSKTFGWLAAKDGIRYVNNYNSSAKAWTTAFWPTGDGSPYYSAEMVGNDTTQAYVGNLRIYKTTNKGTSWTKVFTPENAPYNYPSVGVRAEAIAVSDSLNNIVMAGYYSQNSGQYGGVFYSMDSGTNWSQLLINATSFGQDVNVNDIEMTTDSGKVVAYIGVEYINSNVRGMYKAQWNGTAWSVRREEIYSAATSLFSVTDIIIPSKDTIVAVGSFYNAVLGHSYPISFSISRTFSNTWRSTINDTTRQNAYTACAWSKDTLFYSYQENIYYDIINFNATSTSRVGEALYSTVDKGTEINVMYYDELLVGSTTGFRSMRGATKVYTPPVFSTVSISTANTSVCTGTSVTFNANGTNLGMSPVFNWKKNGVNVGSGTAITFVPNTIGNGDIISCVLTANGLNTTSNSITMTVKQTPTIGKITNLRTGAIVSSIVMCKLNDSIQLINSTANGGWNSSNSSIVNFNIQPYTANKIVTIKSMSIGTATITYNIAANGCVASETATIIIAPITAPASITGVSAMCKGTTSTLSSATSGGIWTSLNNAVAINQNSGLTTATNEGTASIRYTLTNASGCSNFVSYSITVNSIPNVPTIQYAAGTIDPQRGAPNGGFCVGKTFTVVGSPANGLWNATGSLSVTNAGVITINTTGAGSITYTYTNPLGCSNSRSVNTVGYNCVGSRGINNQELIVNTLQFSLYPNPAHSIVNVKIDKSTGIETLTITDLYGKQVKTQSLSLGNNSVDISSLSRGFYLITIINANEKQTQKLVVE